VKARIIIQGLVQGVGYRFFVVQQAQFYQMRGYVRNLSSGHVEVVAEAEKGILDDFIKQLTIGPSSAHITGVDVTWFENEDGFTDFTVTY
jgi:acylphosphatase